MEIALNNYNELLLNIQKTINQTEKNLVKEVNKQKVLMSWKIGEMLDEHLLKNDRAEYGKRLFEKLQNDTGIIVRTLYQMRSFYKSYPELTAENGLSWSHYRQLVSIKDVEKRQYFEDLIVENSLGSNALQIEISKEKKVKKIKNVGKLTFKRGQLFTYKIADSRTASEGFVDCGFKVFTKVETSFNSEDGVLKSVKKALNYSLKKSDVNSNKLHTYKAYLDRVVDGDTLNVTLDLGFNIRHHEILRLAKINAPEKKTVEGVRSSEALKNILKGVKFLVIKTNKTDIYGRYVADVFFSKTEIDPQKVADEGIYLNQLLIDEGWAEKF